MTTETKELIIAKNLVPADIFKAGGMDPILAGIERKAKAHVPDLTTVKGRNAIKSNAAKVASSKTLLDAMGKTLKEKYKVLIDPIDVERKKTRNFLDALKIEVRKPVTDWEAAEEKRKADEAMATEQAEWDAAVIADYDQAFDSAISENDLFNRERDMRIKEEQIRFEEMKRRADENEARLKKEQIEHEEKLKKEAAEKARLDAESKAKAEKELEKFHTDFDEAIAMNKAFDAEVAIWNAELDRVAAEEKAKQEKKDAADRERLAEERRVKEAEEAEQKRLADIKAAEEKAAKEQREAVAAEKARQAAKEKAIKDAQDEKDRQDAERAADIAHRSKVNNEAKECLMDLDIDEDTAIKIVKAIVQGNIKNVSLKY